jgi:hypothetical protein
MMKKQSNKDWLHDVEMRQRNIVFPDTMKNEARFWRNLMDSKGHLSATQIIGISLMYLALIVGWVVLAIIQFRATADPTADGKRIYCMLTASPSSLRFSSDVGFYCYAGEFEKP